MRGLKQKHASGVFDFISLKGAAPTAFGGSPKVFRAGAEPPTPHA